MKKYLLLLMLLMLPCVMSSFETKVYTGWVDTTKTLNISGEAFKFNWIREQNKTIIYLPEGSFMQIDANKDKCAQEGFFRICQTQQKFYYKGKEVPPYITSDINASIYMYINKTDPGLNISRTYVKEMYKDFPTRVKIVISKLPNTREAISSVKLNDSYTKDFKITNLVGCRKDGNSVRLDLDEFISKVSCEYDLTPLKDQTYQSKASLSYTVFERKVKKTKESKMEIKKSPVEFVAKYNATRMIGTPTNFTLSYSIKTGAALDSFTLTYPQEIEIVAYPNSLLQKYNALSLQNKTPKSFNILFTSKKEGNNYIDLDYSYGVNNIKYSDKIRYPINYSAYLFDIEFFKKDNLTIIRLSNSDITEYSNIELHVDNASFALPKLGKRSFKEYVADEPKNMFVIYETEFGQKLTREIVKTPEKEYVNNTEPVVQVKEEKKPFLNIKLDINNSLAYVIVIIVVVVLALFLFILRRPKRLSLDKEIKELQQEEDRSTKDSSQKKKKNIGA